MTKFSYKMSYNLRLKFPFFLKKKNNITAYFENITFGLHVLYILNPRQILCQSDIFYYMICKLIFYS